MKRTRLLLLLVLLMTAATGVWAQQTLTVYDGPFYENYSPANICYIDEYTRSQTVIPSTALTAMKGCDITAMKFYSNSIAASGTIDYSFDVYLKEVSYTAFDESSPTFEPKSSCTSVHQGKLSISNYELTITFSKPFHYNGGNLLLGMENTSIVTYYDITFVGRDTGSSLSNISIHHDTDLASASIKQTAFIPKTTFTYVVPTYTLTLDPAPVTKATVTIDDQAATPDENGKIADVKANSSVKLNANDGYMFKKVKVKKTVPPTLAETLTTAGMTVTVNFKYSGDNYCTFTSVGDGTYTFTNGSGWAGGTGDCEKALVYENGQLVFKQAYDTSLDSDWNIYGYSVFFDTSDNTYSEFLGDRAQSEYVQASFISISVNGTTIPVTVVK